MRLNSRQVEAFRAVMVNGGMTAAADSLYITQPAVSRLIKDLEDDLGLCLFDRRGNMIVPTAEAHALLTEVERSFVGLEALRAYADNLRGARTGSLRIAAIAAMATKLLPRFLASFCRERPEVRILLSGHPSHRVVEGVAGGQFDLGVSSISPERPSVVYTTINGYLMVVLPAHHRLAKLKQIEAPDLAGESIIMLGSRSPLNRIVENALRSVTYRRAIETSYTISACVLASSGAGVTIVDHISAQEFAEQSAVVLPFVPRINAEWHIVHSSHRPMSRLALQFITEFKDYIARTFDDEAK
ncbi:MAG: LysR substrate-binding domain-containing protein [Holophaga sp.]